MIEVRYHQDKFHVKAPFEALGTMRGAPIRRWDKPTDTWILPPVKRVRDYLKFHGAVFHDGAEHAPERRLERTKYDGALHKFKTKPYGHQIDAVGASSESRAFAYFCEPGTGKSKMIVDDLVYQRSRGRLTAAVIVCPNSITGNWADEFKVHMAARYDAHIWEAGGHKRFARWMNEVRDFPILIVAVESLQTASGVGIVDTFLSKFDAALVIDESSRIKTHDTNRTKNLVRLGAKAKVTRIATGTPATQGPHNLWSQFEFMDPAITDMNFFAFRAIFCVMGGYKMKAVVASRDQDMLLEMVAPYVFLATKAECLDLPKKIYQRREWVMSPQQLALYGEIYAETELALVRDLRLHQLLGGFTVRQEAKESLAALLATDPAAALCALTDDPDYINVVEPVPGPNPHLEALTDALEEIPGKVVIWCRYRAEIEIVAQALRPLGGVVEFHGGVAMDDRNAARRAFQTDPEVRFFVGQIQTGGIGITLTAASVEIFYSCDWSAENRIQAEDRIHRIGQEGDHCLYLDLVARGNWVDRRVLDSVQNGVDYHHAIMRDLGHTQG